MSDVIQTTSDLFLSICNALKNKKLFAIYFVRVCLCSSMGYAVWAAFAMPLKIWWGFGVERRAVGWRVVAASSGTSWRDICRGTRIAALYFSELGK